MIFSFLILALKVKEPSKCVLYIEIIQRSDILSAFYLFFLVLYGCVWGSFLTVVGMRIPLRLPFVFSRSHCSHCGHDLKMSELIPVLSYFFQKGKCRQCQAKLSVLYPLSELLTAGLLTLSFLKLPASYADFLLLFILITFGVIFLVADITYQLLPDKVMSVFFLTAILWKLFLEPSLFALDLLSGIMFFLFFISFYHFYPGSIGGGDVKYFGILGFLLGYQQTLFCLLLACLAVILVALPLYLLNKWHKGSLIPFGPFIFFGSFVAAYLEPNFMQHLFSFIWTI